MTLAKKLPKKDKRPMWPLITKKTTPGGMESWEVDGRVGGVGPRTRYKSKSEAQTVAEQLRIQRKNEGVSAFAMSPTDRADASAALEELRPHGYTLREASRFFLQHIKVIRKNISFADAVKEYITVRVTDGIAPQTYYHQRGFLQRVARDFPEQKLIDLTTPALDDWLRNPRPGWGASTRNQNRRMLEGLFSWAVKREYVLENPVSKIRRAVEGDRHPGIFRPHEVRRLLAAADGCVLPCLLLGVFAGLRPQSEVLRLDWSDINFEAKRIEINKSKVRSAQHWNVEMQPNLIEWLLPFRRPGGLIGPCEATYMKYCQQARKKAEIKLWPHDVLRHTYASMHLEKF